MMKSTPVNRPASTLKNGLYQVIALFVFPILCLIGQPALASTPPSGFITGKITSQGNAQPIEYATISLFRSSDSVLVHGSVTDSTGSYRVGPVPYDTYYLKAEFLGFEQAYVSNLSPSRQNQTLDAGQLSLKPAAVSLDAMAVEAERNTVEYQLDKKVINVGESNAAPAGTAIDVLLTAPSIQTDPSGDITLRGSSNFRVLMDGKPSVLSGNDALRNIPSTSIERIELITNPSARYDADGTAGIINIILKQGQKTEGISGFAEASISRFERYSANLMLSQRIGKLNWFVGLDYGDRPTPGSSILERTTMLDDTTRYQLADAERNWLRQTTNFKAGIDYDLSASTSISYSFQGGQRTNAKGTNSLDLQRTQVASDATEEYFLRNYSDDNTGLFTNNVLVVSHQFANKGKLNLDLQYASWDGKHVIGFDQQGSDAAGNPVSDLFLVETTEDNQRGNFQGSLDYTQKLKDKVAIEAGLRSRWVQADAGYQYTDNDPEANPLGNQQAQFNRWIHAAYGTYSGKFKGFDYKLGLRAEYTDRSISLADSNANFDLDHLHWFPSAHLSRPVGKRQQVKASYSRRIQRPGEWDLFPFLTFIDPFNQLFGNPFLEPELTDSYELGFTKGWKRNFLSLEGYHRFTTDAINGVRSLHANNAINSTPANIAERKETGLEGSLNFSLHKNVSLMIRGNVFALQFTGDLNNESPIEEQTVTWNTFSMLNATLPFDSKLMLMGFYYAPSVGPQGETASFWAATARLNKTVLKKKLNIGLEVSDIFRTMRHAFSYNDPAFDVYNQFRFNGQIYKLSLAYSFNKFNQRKVNQRLNKNRVELEPTTF